MIHTAVRRGPIAQAHLATDRLTLPWAALENPHSRAAIIVPWLVMAAVLIFAVMPGFARGPGEVIGRINSLVDIPLVALVVPLDLAFSRIVAESVAAIAIPLLQLLVALALVRGILRCLDFKGASANIGLAIVPLLPFAMASFAPFRIGEQGWEALCALVILRLAVDRRKAIGKAALAGLAAGVLVSLSLSGFFVAAAAGAFYALVYFREGDARSLASYLLAMALGATALLLATQPWTNWALARSDWASWPHLAGCWSAAFAASALVATKRPPAPGLRFLGVAMVAASACAIPAAILGWAILQPLIGPSLFFGSQGFEPVRVGESGWHNAVGMVLATLVLWLAAMTARWRQLARSGNPRGWLAVAVMSGAMVTLALVTYSAALFAQLLAIPFFALLLRDALRVASRMAHAPLRVAGIVLALFVLTPTGGSVTGGLAVSIAEGRSLDWPKPVTHAASGLATIVRLG